MTNTISPNDITVINGEARVSHRQIASGLGTRQQEVARLIVRNQAELAGYGPVSSRNTPIISGKGGTQTATEYMLNEPQALLVCMFARTERAAMVRKAVIEVFTAWRNGTLEQLEEDRPDIAALKRRPGYPKEGRIFDEDTIRIIRAEHRVGVPQREIAAKYDVSVTTINRIVNNLCYKDVKGLPTIKAPDDGFDDAAYMALMVLRMYDEVSDLCGIVTSDTTELRKLARDAVTFAGKSLVKAAQHAA